MKYLSLVFSFKRLGLWAVALTISWTLRADNLENPPIPPPCAGEWSLVQWLSADYETNAFVERDQDGYVTKWVDRSGNGNDLMPEYLSGRPSFIENHPSGAGTIAFNGGQILKGSPAVDNNMEQISVIVVWRASVPQDARVWQQGNLSLDVRADGTYGFSIDDVPQLHSYTYREHEHVVSILWLQRDAITGDTEGHLFHNGLAHDLPMSLGPITISYAPTAVGGSAAISANWNFFRGEIQELLVYETCINQERFYFTNLFRDAYNLGLDTTGDGFPDSPTNGDASWDGIPNWWLAHQGQNPWDPNIASQNSDITGLTWLAKFLGGDWPRWGHWPLTEGIGSNALDHSIFGNHGELSATGVSWRNDGYGIVLDGQGQVTVEDPEPESLDYGEGSLTLSGWFRSTDTTGWKGFFSKGGLGGWHGYGLGLYSGSVFASLGGEPGRLFMRTVDPYNDGQWHHAAAVFDRDQEKAWIYIDGVKQAITRMYEGTVVGGDTLDFAGVTGPTATSDKRFFIGAMAHPTTGDPIQRVVGDVAGVHVYDRVLNESAVYQLFWGSGIPDWWKMMHFGTIAVNPYDDPDGDGYPNIFEYFYGTDPNDPSPLPSSDLYLVDLVGDGIPSGWKLENSLDPFTDLTGLSPDGSLLTYLELYQLSLAGGEEPSDANVAGLIIYTP